MYYVKDSGVVTILPVSKVPDELDLKQKPLPTIKPNNTPYSAD
jgi:hypothetical protein